MKVSTTNFRIPETGSRRSAGKSAVETCLFLVLAYFGMSYGIDWVKEKQESQLTDARLREIAERVVTVTEAAEMAGVQLILANDITGTIDRVSQGETARRGLFAGQYFGVPELEGKAKDAVAEHLRLENGRLVVIVPNP